MGNAGVTCGLCRTWVVARCVGWACTTRLRNDCSDHFSVEVTKADMT